MARVEFRTVEQRFEGIGQVVATVVPRVDGVSLIDLVRDAELPHARRDGDATLAGSYAGIADERVRWPSRHFVGRPALSWHDGDTVLLGCPCGDWGCWPFTALVTVGPGTVTWTGYRTGHREWSYDALRPLHFDRRQYEEAVRRTAE